MRLFIATILFLFSSAAAEVPGHNSRLDSECPNGFQWSRKVAGCAQAECPEGAKRTYTLECSCGEAWKKPFRTCTNSDGLATHCVEKDAYCFGGQEGLGKEQLHRLPEVHISRPQHIRKKGRVSSASGNVYLYSQVFQRWRGPVRPGEIVSTGDVLLIRKGGNANVILYLPEGEYEMKFGEETIFEVQGYFTPEEPNTALGLLRQGLMSIKTRFTTGKWPKPKGRHIHNILSPTISTGVRGTEYTISHHLEPERDTVTVREGIVLVDVLKTGERFELNAGDSFLLKNGEAAVERKK